MVKKRKRQNLEEETKNKRKSVEDKSVDEKMRIKQKGWWRRKGKKLNNLEDHNESQAKLRA
jgi:hypothetical protein